LVIDRKPSSRENQPNNSNAFRRVEPVKSDRLLGAELAEIFAIDPLLLDFTGFTMPEFDLLVVGLGDGAADEADSLLKPAKTAVSRLGDLWEFAGGHKLLCANSRDAECYARLLGTEIVQMVITDPPYGCAIKGHVSRTHGEFVEGSRMNEAESFVFFGDFLPPMTCHLADGAIVDIFIDSRGMFPLQQAIRAAGLEQKTIAFWDKGGGGMGSPYRQQGEFVVITKWGKGPHIDNIQLGKYGRNRTTLWQAPGLAQFGKGRKEALELHPTVKPASLVMDALLDTSHPGGIILDPFAGSGTTLLAAHRTGRIGRAIELDPIYVDVAIRRMEALTGQSARHEETGLTFEALARQRSHEDSAELSSSLAPVPASL
jgi:DNA modification methylase